MNTKFRLIAFCFSNIPLRILLGFMISTQIINILPLLTLLSVGAPQVLLFSAHLLAVGMYACGASLLFLTGKDGNQGGGILTFIGFPEFLLTKPFKRTEVFIAQTIVLFCVVIFPFLLCFAVSFVYPDMRFSLSHSEKYETDAYRELAQYQFTFPRSQIIPSLEGSQGDLLIPNGWSALCLWQIWMAFFVAIIVQCFFCSSDLYGHGWGPWVHSSEFSWP